MIVFQTMKVIVNVSICKVCFGHVMCG
jgi:hypothetical protein